MVGNVLFENRRKMEVFRAVQTEVTDPSRELHDVTLVCGDGQRIQSDQRLLGLVSPLVRGLLGQGRDVLMLSLPDFPKSTVLGVLRLLAMGWMEQGEVGVTRDQQQLLRCLGVQLLLQDGPAPDTPATPSSVSARYTCTYCDEEVEDKSKHWEQEHLWDSGPLEEGVLDKMFTALSGDVDPPAPVVKNPGNSISPTPPPTQAAIIPLQSKLPPGISLFSSLKSIKVTKVQSLKQEPQSTKMTNMMSVPKPLDTAFKYESRSVSVVSKPAEYIDTTVKAPNGSIKFTSDEGTKLVKNIENQFGSKTLKCIRCEKEFKANESGKQSLRIHIGIKHFNRELELEMKQLFDQNNCLDCKLEFKFTPGKKSHLALFHTKYSTLIKAETEKIIQGNFTSNVQYIEATNDTTIKETPTNKDHDGINALSKEVKDKTPTKACDIKVEPMSCDMTTLLENVPTEKYNTNVTVTTENEDVGGNDADDNSKSEIEQETEEDIDVGKMLEDIDNLIKSDDEETPQMADKQNWKDDTSKLLFDLEKGIAAIEDGQTNNEDLIENDIENSEQKLSEVETNEDENLLIIQQKLLELQEFSDDEEDNRMQEFESEEDIEKEDILNSEEDIDEKDNTDDILNSKEDIDDILNAEENIEEKDDTQNSEEDVERDDILDSEEDIDDIDDILNFQLDGDNTPAESNDDNAGPEYDEVVEMDEGLDEEISDEEISEDDEI